MSLLEVEVGTLRAGAPRHLAEAKVPVKLIAHWRQPPSMLCHIAGSQFTPEGLVGWNVVDLAENSVCIPCQKRHRRQQGLYMFPLSPAGTVASAARLVLPKRRSVSANHQPRHGSGIRTLCCLSIRPVGLRATDSTKAPHV